MEARLERLERELLALKDRQEILDCVARHARGCDRFDGDVLGAVYHEGGFDEHGFAVNPGPEYWEWANRQHAGGSQHNMHNITTHLCEVDGDEAHAESYVIGLFLSLDGQTSRILAGRYIDRLERRDGRWAIVVRRSTVEVMMKGDAWILTSPDFAKLGFLKGMRDSRDLSYRRPLTMEDDGHERW